MATFIFDGTTSITAAKTDTVVISANPALFTGAADNTTGGSVFTYSGGATLTITGTNFGPTATSFPNVSLANGDFITSANATTTKASTLIFAPGTTTSTGVIDVSAGGTAAGVKAVFGGLGVADPADGPDSIIIGGKGSVLVYGNAGNDIIGQNGAFDSTSFVTVFGGKGNDNIVLNAANTGAHMAIYGSENGTGAGAQVDTITVTNTGVGSNTTIFGGVGAADPNDGADNITFNGGGAVQIFANAGNDTVTFTAADSTGNFTVHGGIGTDLIQGNSNGFKTTIQFYGDEGGDSFNIGLGNGTNVLYGDTAAADPNGGADSFQLTTAGITTIYAAGGNDTVRLVGPAGGNASTDTLTIFGGDGADSVQVIGGAGYTSAGTGSISITLGAGSDTVNLAFSGIKGNTYSIEDFVPTSGGDKLIITTTAAQAQATTVTGTFQTMQQALDAAAQGPVNSISAVVYNGSTYVVVNNATAGFNPTNDLAIKLTGVTDLASVVTSVSGV